MGGEWKVVEIDRGEKFKVPEEWELIKKVGSGQYGTVASFRSSETKKKVAVRKVTDAFKDYIDVRFGKAVVREVLLLRSLEHDSLLRILDMFAPEHPDFEDFYLVTDLMDTDLHRVIYSKQKLTDEHWQYFTYQILRSVLYLHSADVVHGALRPSKILVNKNCDLKVTGFGHAWGSNNDAVDSSDDATTWVLPGCSSKWYHAPERTLLAITFLKPVDIWSVGCILCELVGRRPIFPGKDHLDQIKNIIRVTGTPTEDDLDFLPRRSPARSFINKIPVSIWQHWSSVYPKATPSGIEAMSRMLAFHPERRATAQGTLALPYFEALHQPEEEPLAENPYDWPIDKITPTKRLLRNRIYLECADFHPEILDRDAALLAERGISDRRRKIPLQLDAREAEEGVTITCTNLAGELVGRFEDMAWRQPFAEVATLVRERVRPPRGARWQVVLPDGACPGDGQLDQSLDQLFAV